MSDTARPTKYKKSYCDDIVRFFAVPPSQTVYKKTYYADGGVKSEEPIVLPADLPTFQAFASSIGVHVDTLHEWRQQHEEFSEAYMRAKQMQESIWLVNGMSGRYNAQFAQFFGKNCLGYSDKSEVEHSGHIDSNNPYAGLTTEELRKLAGGDG